MSHLLLPCGRTTWTWCPSFGLWAVLDPAGMCWACRAGAGPVREGPVLSALPDHQEQDSRSYFHQQHAAGDTHCWAVPDASHHPHPCSAFLAVCCRMAPCRGGHCPVPHGHPHLPAHLPSPVKVQLGGHTLPHIYLKRKDSSLGHCWAGYGWKATLHRTTLRQDCSLHPGTGQHIPARARPQQSNANRHLEKGSCACELTHFSNCRKSCKDQEVDPIKTIAFAYKMCLV